MKKNSAEMFVSMSECVKENDYKFEVVKLKV